MNLTPNDIHNKRIIEVGSYDLNGSLRPILELWNPSEYVGVDITAGPGVDIICSAEDIIGKFNKNSFDIVISTELIEHIRDWRRVVSNIKHICKPGGTILITTRSYGFKYHGYPYDFWRFELEDMKEIFSDCVIHKLESDKIAPGVFLKAQKPLDFVENDLSYLKLFSVITNERVINIEDTKIENFLNSYYKRQKYEKRLGRISNHLKNGFYKLIVR